MGRLNQIVRRNKTLAVATHAHSLRDSHQTASR